MKRFITVFISLVFFGLLTLPVISFGLEVGEQAPSFSANSTQGQIILDDFIGKENVVLALYYAVFSPV
jgi:hypothetical protein